MKCNCKDWKENNDKLSAGFSLLFARNPDTYKGYEGKQFIYCPWCGERLKERINYGST